MDSEPLPASMWRLVVVVFWATLVSIVVTASLLSLGAADPPRAGRLAWENDFADLAGWETFSAHGAGVAVGPRTLHVTLPASGATFFLVTDAPEGDITLEVAGAQTDGAIGAGYGLVFDFVDPDHYAAVTINGNGYAHAYRQAGQTRVEWFKFSQWPHVLVGTEANRIRVDFINGHLTFRINDEVLAVAQGRAGGRLGVVAQASEAGQAVIFPWAKLWADSSMSTMAR